MTKPLSSTGFRPSTVDRRHQRGIAARGRRVDAGHALGREARDIMRAAGLGPGAAQALAAERLAFDHRADLVAVDVEIADPGMLLDIVADGVDAALQAERQAVAGRVDLPRPPRRACRRRSGRREESAPKFSRFNWLSELIS